MVDNILNKIINKKKQKLNELKKIISIEALREKIKQNKSGKFVFSHKKINSLK